MNSQTDSYSYTHVALRNGVTYYYVVSATNISSASSNSIQVSATPQCIVPPPPRLPASQQR